MTDLLQMQTDNSGTRVGMAAQYYRAKHVLTALHVS